MTTSGMLILAALSFGCGADSTSSVLPASVGPLGAVPQQSDFAPFASTQSAQRVSGNDADVETANMTADGLFAILRGGALEAASPTGGAIADQSALQLAALSGGGEASPSVASDAQLPGVAVSSLKRLLVNSGPQFTFEGQTLTIMGGGTQLTITGVSPLPAVEGEPSQPPLLGFTLSADMHATGALGGDQPLTVDVRVRGLTGTLRFVENQDPIFDLTVGESGVAVSGSIGDVSGSASATGATGRFTNLAELNTVLAGRDLKVRLADVRINDVIARGQASATVRSLQLPIGGDRPTGRIFGSGDVAFDGDLPFAHDGKVAHASVEVAESTALVFDAQTDGPRSGTIVATVHYASSGKSDTLTITFENGEPLLNGVRTNFSGNEEQVTTQGDTTSATGSVVFTDGRRTDHRIEVRRRTGGRRHIIFRVAIKSREGIQVLNLVGAVRPDRSLSGTWARGVGLEGSAGTANALPAGAQALKAVPEKAGTFRVTAEGQLELVNEAGEVLARGSMPGDWNRGL